MLCPSVHCFVLLLHPVWHWIPLVIFQFNYSSALWLLWGAFSFLHFLSLCWSSHCAYPLLSQVQWAFLWSLLWILCQADYLSLLYRVFFFEVLYCFVLFCFEHIYVQFCLILHVRWISYLSQSWRRCLCRSWYVGITNTIPLATRARLPWVSLCRLHAHLLWWGGGCCVGAGGVLAQLAGTWLWHAGFWGTLTAAREVRGRILKWCQAARTSKIGSGCRNGAH